MAGHQSAGAGAAAPRNDAPRCPDGMVLVEGAASRDFSPSCTENVNSYRKQTLPH